MLPFIGAILYGLWSYHQSESHYGALDAHGVDAQASVIAKQVITTGSDRLRSAYDMTVDFSVEGRLQRGHLRVTKGFYDSHSPADRVLIRYLPSDPQTRMIDPAMRGRSAVAPITIVCLLLFIGVANVFFVDNRAGAVWRSPKEQRR